jgi:hypothetical protein
MDANKDRITPGTLRSATETPIKPKKNTPVIAISKKIKFLLSISSSKFLNNNKVNVNHIIITDIKGIVLPIPYKEVYTCEVYVTLINEGV